MPWITPAYFVTGELYMKRWYLLPDEKPERENLDFLADFGTQLQDTSDRGMIYGTGIDLDKGNKPQEPNPED